jgi:hypothetical protein
MSFRGPEAQNDRPAFQGLERQDKPGRSCKLKGAYPVIAHLTGSRPGVGGSNLAGEALEGEPASRSASEPDSASLRRLRAAKLPDLTKPATGDEGMGYEQSPGSPGWEGTARGDRSAEEPGRPGGVA